MARRAKSKPSSLTSVVTNNEVADCINGTPKKQGQAVTQLVSINPVKWVGEPTRSLGDLWDFNFLQLPYLWSHWGVRGENVNIAVIDSGIDKTHSAFAQHANIITKSFLPGVPSAEDKTGHGTWVSGKIAGQGIGIAPRCNLWVMRVLDESGTGSSEFTAKALEWVSNNVKRLHIVNLSLGGPTQNENQRYYIEKLNKLGTIVMAATGNFGVNDAFYPACYPGVMAIGALDDTGSQLAPFSNWGSEVDAVAPGVACYSSVPGQQFRKMQGTSMATPIASGLLALGFSWLEKTHNFPLPKAKEIVLGALKDSCTDLGEKGWDNKFGWGAISGAKFMECVVARTNACLAEQS